MATNIERTLQQLAESQLLLMKRMEANSLPSYPVNRAIAPQQTAQNFYGTGGLFADCALDRPVLNAMLSPTNTIANDIPVIPTRDSLVKYGFITDIADAGAGPMDYPCDDPPQVGDVSACFASFGIGRLEYSTETLEVDELIMRAHQGIREDLYFVGDIRGVSAIPSDRELDRGAILGGAVNRQMQLWGRSTQKTLNYWFWNGDPTAGPQNGAHGGWKSFWGLNSLIADDYDDKDFVTGTNCAALNSDVKDFSTAEGGGVVGVDGIYEWMQELEDTIYQRASYMNVLPARWKWVMHPILWGQIVKHLPCEMLSDTCSTPNNPNASVVLNVNDGGGGFANMTLREQMKSSMTIDVNGRTYEVKLDDFAPITKTVGQNEYTGTIFFVPYTVGGEDVLYWRNVDYTLFDQALSPLPGNQTDMLGWTDGGRYHFVIQHNGRCFIVRGKVQPALVFRAPHLAGRIDGVKVRTLQTKPLPDTTPA